MGLARDSVFALSLAIVFAASRSDRLPRYSEVVLPREGTKLPTSCDIPKFFGFRWASAKVPFLANKWHSLSRLEASFWDIDEAFSAHYFSCALIAIRNHSSISSIRTALLLPFLNPFPTLYPTKKTSHKSKRPIPLSYASNSYIVLRNFFPGGLAHRLGLEPASLLFIVDSSLRSF